MALRFAATRLPMLRGLLPRVTPPLLPTSLRTAPTTRLLPNLATRLASSSRAPNELSQGASLSQRLKHLIKSYGWYALGVYLVLSALDFGVAFAAINLLGAEQVSSVAASVKTAVWGFFHTLPPEPGKDELEPAAGQGHEGIYAMIVLAYTIHKTLFLPIRVGLTAALTPRIVGWLRSKGWAGGDGTRRAAEEMRQRIRGRIGRD